MTFDITFCNGEVKFTQNNCDGTLICPVKDKCQRYWSSEVAEEAVKTNHIYNSFFMLTDPNILTDKGCDHFWKKDK